MNRSMPGLPVHHHLPEFTQTHVHRVSDAIQPSHAWSSPSPPAPNPSQHQSLFQWVSSLHEVAKVLEFQLQHHSFQRNPRVDLLQNGLAGSPCSLRDSLRHSSKASILRHSAFFIVQLSHPYVTTGKTIALIRWTFVRYSALIRPFKYSLTMWNRATENTSFPLNVDNHSYSWTAYQNMILKPFTCPTRRHM